MSTENRWLTIMDYAVKNDVSLSTIRRYIKSNKVNYRMEHGRYMLLDEAPPEHGGRELGVSMAGYGHTTSGKDVENRIENRIDHLEMRLNDAVEQIGELKMLVALYEDKLQDQ